MPEPVPIPIYDDTAPVACTLTTDEIPERVELVERLRLAMTTVARTTNGLLLHFPDQPEVRADLVAFAIDEQRCCQFWGFDISDEPDGIALRWDGPPAVEHLLDRLHGYFRGDLPMPTLDGLL